MLEPSSSPTVRGSRPLLLLCGALFFLAVIQVGLGIFAFVRDLLLAGGLFLLAAVVTAGAGVGIYRMRRWGVLLFGALSLALSLNHVILVFDRYQHLPSGPVQVIGALLDLLFSILIPLALFYLTVRLWRQFR